MKTPCFSKIIITWCALFIFCGVFATASRAATFNVTNTGDNGPGTLRQAIVDANANAGADTITFAAGVTGTISLFTALPNLADHVAISGPGADVLTVQRASGQCSDNGAQCTNADKSLCGSPATAVCNAATNFRIFTIDSGKTVTISGLTISGGSASGSTFPDNRGGGIFNRGPLTITNSTVSGNSAFVGGGIYDDGEQGSGAALTVTNSTISGNAAGFGGGIVNVSATMTLSNSTISGNSATDPAGVAGGVYNAGDFCSGSATLTVSNSTFSGNSAPDGGSAIYNDGGTPQDCGPPSTATLNITNTVLNSEAPSANLGEAHASIVMSHGYNLSSDAAGGDPTTGPGGLLNATGDIRNTDPMLDPNGLQDNGGPTLTIALQPNSPAINAGEPNFTPPPDFDQRGTGFPRVVNNRIDIGAFEVQNAPACPHPKGYWKSNPALWPLSSLMLGSQTYLKPELLNILKMAVGTGPKADASLILADQLIAAKLNIANGSDPTPVASTITHADSLLSALSGKLPYKIRTNSTNGKMMVTDANALNNYNNGLLTPVCTP
jgi:hypothetical protein